MNSTSPWREAGQHRGEVAGALDRRPAGDPHRGAQLGADDHGEAGLAQPGRAGQQDVVRRPAPAHGALEHQLELLARPRLADELGQRARPQRRLGLPLLVAGLRATRRASWPSARVAPSPGQRARSNAARSCPAQQLDRLPQQHGDLTAPVAAICSSATGASAATAPSASLPVQPRPTSAGAPGPATAPRRPSSRRRPRRRRGVRRGAPIRSRSSRTSRSAPFLPMPGTRMSVLTSPIDDRAAHLARRVHGQHRLGQPRARRRSRSAAARTAAARRRRRSRTGSASPRARPGWSPAGPPPPPAAGRWCPGVHCTARPTPPTSTTAPSGETAATRPRTLAIIGPPPRPARQRRRPAPARRCHRPAPPPAAVLGRAAPDVADGQRQRVGGVGRLGRRGEPQQPGDHARDLRLVRPAGAGDGGLDLARRVQATGRPARAAASTATPAACAVPITVPLLCWVNTRSTATDVGPVLGSSAVTAVCSSSSRSSQVELGRSCG